MRSINDSHRQAAKGLSRKMKIIFHHIAPDDNDVAVSVSGEGGELTEMLFSPFLFASTHTHCIRQLRKCLSKHSAGIRLKH